MTTVEYEIDRMRDAARREVFADVERAKLHARQLGTAWIRHHSTLILASGALAGAVAVATVSRRSSAAYDRACPDGDAKSDADSEGTKHEEKKSEHTKSALAQTLGSLARAWLANAFLDTARE